MKKLFSIVLTIAAVGVMASCGGGTSTPGAAAKKYTEAMAAGNYDKFLDGLYLDPEATPEEVTEFEQQKAMLGAMIKEKGAEQTSEKGGIKGVEIVSEEISEDGLTAAVTMLLTYGNGETEESEMEMRHDGKEWKMDMSK
ncbi:MAG: DUF4878 domain-containing protein [Alistipes sp.]|jgi:dihydroorotase|nr:DUF4878 domain-containing protein [Alistipes sp.]